MDTRERGYADPKLPHGSAYCKCVGCGLYFKSDYSFGLHRREGRCLTPDEMRERGMSVNEAGYWISRVYDRDTEAA